MYPPFSPSYPTVSAASGAGSSSSPVALTAYSASVGKQVLVSNPSAQLAFVKFGPSTAAAPLAAAVTDTPVLPASQRIFTIGPDVSHAAVIASAAATVYFTSGHGE
jgi:hypothetical protein